MGTSTGLEVSGKLSRTMHCQPLPAMYSKRGFANAVCVFAPLGLISLFVKVIEIYWYSP